MKTAGRETHNHWDRAHGVVGQEQTCSIKWAAKPRKIPAAGGLFFLTLPFIELTRHVRLLPSCPLFGRDPLFAVRLRLSFGVRRRRRHALRLFRSAFGNFPLLTPFRLRPLLFLTLHFLLALFERDAHWSPQKFRATPNIIESSRVTSAVRAAGEPIRGNPHARIRCDRDHHLGVRRRRCCARGAHPWAAPR